METRVRMDEQGRIYIPKEMRERMKERVFMVKEEKGTYIFKPLDVVREGRGVFRVKKPIGDIDEKIEEYTREAIEDELR